MVVPFPETVKTGGESLDKLSLFVMSVRHPARGTK